jgi:hypothetical protein
MAGGAKRQGRRGTSEQPANTGTPDVENEQRTQNPPVHSLPIQTSERSRSETPEDDDAQNPVTETLQEKHARLTAAVAEKRMREEIEEMEREIAGETPAGRGRGKKRIVSDTAETSDSHKFYFRSKSPPIFEGKTLKEVSIFKTRWEIEFAV